MKQNKRSSMGSGIFFILLGAFFYALNTGQFRGETGNLFMVFIGGLFLALYLLTGQEWAVYPGSFILVSGIAIYVTSQGLNLTLYWPLLILLPGLGFVIILILTPHNRWALLPGAATIAIALLFFAINFGLIPGGYDQYVSYLPPVGFTLWGFKLIIFPRK